MSWLGKANILAERSSAVSVHHGAGTNGDMDAVQRDGVHYNILELYNKVMLTLNHRYQKPAGMVGIVYGRARGRGQDDQWPSPA